MIFLDEIELSSVRDRHREGSQDDFEATISADGWRSVAFRRHRDRGILLAHIDAQAAEITRLRDQRAKALAHCYASDDGTEYEHEHPEHEGEPECPACWAADIRTTLGENR